MATRACEVGLFRRFYVCVMRSSDGSWADTKIGVERYPWLWAITRSHGGMKALILLIGGYALWLVVRW